MPAKKAPAKKAAKKKAAPKAAPAKSSVKAVKTITDKLTKSELLQILSDHSEVSKKEVAAVLGSLEQVINASIKKRALGEFTIPGLMKIVTSRKPATKARKGTNPFTGEETTFAAKPARTVVRIRPLKKLKDMVQ